MPGNDVKENKNSFHRTERSAVQFGERPQGGPALLAALLLGVAMEKARRLLGCGPCRSAVVVRVWAVRLVGWSGAARRKIQFSEYAHISVPDVWTGDRNPVRYTTLDDLGIDLTGAKFEKFEDQSTTTQAPTSEVAALTIRQAKDGLAKTYEVDVGYRDSHPRIGKGMVNRGTEP